MRKYFECIGYGIVLVFAQLYVILFGKKLLDKNIWLFSEKKTEARDNGYHFFKFVRAQHPEICAVYVIRKGWPDVVKVKSLGEVVYYDSFRHCVLYFAAKFRLCSQLHGARPFEQYSGLVARTRFYQRLDQRHINLKHGVSKDFRPDAFDFHKNGHHYDLYIAAAKPEYDYIKKMFNYPDKNIALTGFCRFDALYDLPVPEKIILIMPTFRNWLRTSDSSKIEANEEEMRQFVQSRYYDCYSKLLTDLEFCQMVAQCGYRVVFYLHYTFQPFSGTFGRLLSTKMADIITIARRNDYDVQDLLKRAAVLITDFSSVMFDFAYMGKPVVYYQFDEEEYREKHYQKGYFDYYRDGFGPIFTNKSRIVTYIKELIERNMVPEHEYQTRMERFFVPHDNHNCERVYQAVLRLNEHDR